jgi:hypothetical protein
MKKKNEKKKNRPASSKRKDKKKVVRRTKSNNKKAGNKRSGKKDVDNVRRIKRSSGKRSHQSLTTREKEIYRSLISLVKQDEQLEKQLRQTKKKTVKPARAKKLRYKKGRGENLFEIDVRDYDTLAEKIEGVRLFDDANVKRFLRGADIEPAYVSVTFQDDNDETGKSYFEAYLSPPEMVVDAANTKQFILESIVEHNDQNIFRIMERYDDDDFTPNELVLISFRFLFPF